MWKNKLINQWNLFWLVSGVVSLAMILAMVASDLSSGDSLSALIQLSVQCAVPLLYLTFAASSLQIVYASNFSRWLLKNRKYIGLCFAAAMAWQLLFILWMVLLYRDYYVGEVYVLRDTIEGVGGYILLIAMIITSFKFTRKHMSTKSWRLLHKTGIYFLWAYAFSVYWWALFFYGDAQVIDYIFYLGGFVAWALRAGAWAKRNKPKVVQPIFRSLGFLIIGFGLAAATLGKLWQPASEQILHGYSFTRIPELVMPYWPFEPFLPLLIIGFGVYLLSREGDVVQKEITIPG